MNHIYLNNTLENWLISFSLLIVALVVNKIISFINGRYLKKLAGKTQTPLDNIIVNTLETPLKVAIILIAIWTALDRLHFSDEFNKVIYDIYEILTILNITWFVSHLFNGLINVHFSKRNERFYNSNNTKSRYFDTHFISLIRKISMSIIWTIGMVTALSNVGIDIKAILGTLGLGGIAIALASQDTVKNVFGGFTILLDSTFRIGDRIKIGEFEGVVEDIGIRSTKIRNSDNQLVTMSNFKIVDGAVTNLSAANYSRVLANLNISYSNNSEKVQRAISILQSIAKNNDAIDNNSISVSLEISDNQAFNLRYCYFVMKGMDKLTVMTEINSEVIRQFEHAEIEFQNAKQVFQLNYEK